MDADFLAEYVHGRHTTDDYFDRFVREREFEAALADLPTDLRHRCSAALRSALIRLDALPRTDPLWARSNNRATFTKLREHPELTPIADSDLGSCWGAFVIALCSGDLDRFEDATDVLLRTSELGVSDFLSTAFNLLGTSGWHTDVLAAAVLVRRDLAATARPMLDDLEKQAAGDRSRWAERVLERLGPARASAAGSRATDDLIASMQRFVSGEAISVADARALEGLILASAFEFPELEELADDLAEYRPGGGDYLYDFNAMKPRVARHLALIRARPRTR